MSLVSGWLATGKPLLGICRGAQMLQVAAGGTLIQDLATSWPNVMRLGVQWHPEEMDGPIPERLFANFIHHVECQNAFEFEPVEGG